MAAALFCLVEEHHTGMVTAYPCSTLKSNERTIVGVCVTPWNQRIKVDLGHFNALFSPVSFEFLVNVLFHTFETAELLILLAPSTWDVLLYTWRRDLGPELKPMFMFRRRYTCID